MRFSLLGPLGVTREGAAVDLGSPKQRAVLALMLLDRGHVVSTERICAAVWGERLPANTTASLHAYISNLRRLLRDDVTGTSPIVRQPPGYLLDIPAKQTDLGEFRALATAARTAADAEDWPVVLSTSERALALWRGPLLADLADRDWVSVAATGLDEIVVECREHHLSALLASAQIAPALVEVAALRRAHPLRDRSCWLHMLTLYRAGRSPEALEVYRRHAAHLDEELGLEPGPELRDLQGSILRHDPELTAWPRRPGWTGARPTEAPAPATPPTPRPTADPPPTSTLVGRRREIEAVEHLAADVVAGATRWLTLVGPAGIGKTRLAQFASNRVIELGGSAVWARNPEETTPIWWSMRQLVRGLGDDADTVLAVPAGVDPDTARFAIYERVQELIENHARSGPLALVVDDVQWTDPASLGCLAYLSTALTDRSVAVVLTLRDQATDPALTRLLAGAARGQANRQMAIPAMTPTEVAILADQIAEESLTDAERATLAERTGGNPLFVSEYARLSRAERAEG
ncbi:BTAD domain-containing putative transcriptional regulator [Williamsia phyllosphaerae]|uniref:OmpR/PhoB-type domain-containing protein n=1 Tax=Williamsia phyllosphaerae TaxID=885042 RepID=A0ABQ1USL5_9NOCA|nr:BTAD domain-containing putative transcriptional regulator [Williamsia phyllosphaerae]GGF26083.1 hypothetical protein GCM10007298_22460 [Williamsia phyllosphaerae]